MRTIAGIIASVGIVSTVGVAAQSFDVATVKPTPAEAAGVEQPSIVQFQPGAFRRTNSTLRTIVRTAFNVQDYQVTGGPDWADSLRFDIEARMTGPATRDETLRMLQALVADRFQLKTRRETKEGPIYRLVRAAGRPLPPQSVDSSSASVRFGEYSGKRSMAQLAQYLGGIVGRPVVDGTDLAGNFDMRLTFAPDLRDTERTSIFAALPEQLGVRLEAARGAIETIAIESASLPSPN